MSYPQSAWHKAIFKWPVHLWRLGLAPVIGHHMLLITHTGRKSGLPRRTMTELYKLEGNIYAPCAFGERAQWYKNIVADPRVTVQTAHGTQSSLASRVTNGNEILKLLESVGTRSKMILDSYLDLLDIKPDPEDIVAKKERIYWIRFDPTDEPTPPSLNADLVWIWPVAAVGLFAFVLSRRIKGISAH